MLEQINLINNFIAQNPVIFWAVFIWSLAWKGIALWKSARLNKMWWFIPLLVINTMGILEILYIFIFSEKRKAEFSVKS